MCINSKMLKYGLFSALMILAFNLSNIERTVKEIFHMEAIIVLLITAALIFLPVTLKLVIDEKQNA